MLTLPNAVKNLIANNNRNLINMRRVLDWARSKEITITPEDSALLVLDYYYLKYNLEVTYLELSLLKKVVENKSFYDKFISPYTTPANEFQLHSFLNNSTYVKVSSSHVNWPAFTYLIFKFHYEHKYEKKYIYNHKHEENISTPLQETHKTKQDWEFKPKIDTNLPKGIVMKNVTINIDHSINGTNIQNITADELIIHVMTLENTIKELKKVKAKSKYIKAEIIRRQATLKAVIKYLDNM